ncbi:hypothetical protein QJS10_CPA05g01637 [Acorus calamus]|uniref:Uncharacterized protein n=1 Tax=Acorus calamus TaxID=4465 RepID=A0AAV9ETK1_ACOCL|nr:hypothetical protein QJS10_CPA05g01637 [Acorus calamus]
MRPPIDDHPSSACDRPSATTAIHTQRSLTTRDHPSSTIRKQPRFQPGYMLYEHVLRPAEVGVTKVLDGEENQSSEG